MLREFFCYICETFLFCEMDSPFIYNRPVSGRYFVGRKTECTVLGNMLRDGENVSLYEAPKTGKGSILQQVFSTLKLESRQFRVVSVSAMNVRSVSDFCIRLGSEILKAYGSTSADYASLVADHLAGSHFVFDELMWQNNGSILTLDWEIDEVDIRSVISLPYRIAQQSNNKLFVCIDEFQSVMLTEDGDAICKVMQEVFKARTAEDRQSAAYILCGSRVNAMKEIFEHRRLFHRQVERVKLEDIDSKDIVDSVNRGFLMSGKVVDRGLMLGVCELFQNNIYYINFFASLCDALSKGYIMEPVLNEALADMVAIHEPRFRAIMADLTTFQVSLLRAILDGHTRFSSAEVIRRYDLNSSANVRRLKDALCKKEIITFDSDDNPQLLDPLFEYWVTKYYFEIQ